MAKDYAKKLLPGEREAVRKGGHIVHIIQLNADGKCERMTKAICGDGPKESRVRSFTRAGWYGTVSEANCPKCLAVLASR